MGRGCNTWYAGMANSGLLQIPDITGARVGVRHGALVLRIKFLSRSGNGNMCWKTCGRRGMHVCPWTDEYDVHERL